MRNRWAKAFLWSTAGGVAVGFAAVLAGSHRRIPSSILKCQRIPEGCDRVVLWTEGFQIEEPDGAHTVHDTYVLQVTPFKAWSVLELPAESDQPGREGSTVYHVTHLRAFDGLEKHSAEKSVLERYYGTIVLIDPHRGKPCGRNRLARGGVLQVSECLVGGAANAVETGKIQCSEAPILNFRFEYSPAGVQLHAPSAEAS